MLSICIPIHQYPVRPLILALQKEIQENNLPCNLICADDGSDQNTLKQNDFLLDDQSIQYEALPQNIGRSAIRNHLARLSDQPFLLFLDVDVMPSYPDFLRRYLHDLSASIVVYGGTVYSATAPEDPLKRFHWRYGHAKEQIQSSRRNQDEYRSFKTNNFVVQRDFFLTNPLDESLTGYGHEDSLFAYRCARQGVRIRHIDNPVLHLGLENQAVLSKKLESSLDNLYRLYQKNELPETPLAAIFKPGMLRWLSGQLNGLLPVFRNKLTTDVAAPMILLDLYKLIYLKDHEQKVMSSDPNNNPNGR